MAQRNLRVIDLDAIRYNMASFRAAVPEKVRLMAVVKADAYGHGALEVSRAVLESGADMLAVATVSEGAFLRKHGISVPILVLGAVCEEDAAEGAASGLTQTVCSPEMVRICEEAARQTGCAAEVHLKFDTGMGRIGVRSEEERDAVLAELERSEHVRLTGAFTHFSDADGDEEGRKYTKGQFKKFRNLTASLPENVLRHCCNSAAAMMGDNEMFMDIARIGIALYGYPPVNGQPAVKRCMRWTTNISFVKDIPPDEYVSYGRTWKSDSIRRIATVSCGYADGYFRSAGSMGEVLVNGKKYKIVGRICMDQMMIDITGNNDIRAGDEAVLLGRSGSEEITADDIASWCGTISYEILTSFSGRGNRIFTGRG